MHRLFALGLFCLLCSCGEEEFFEPLDLDRDLSYFPVELNRPLIYDLDSIVVFRTVGGVRYDTARSQVREELVEAFEGADGQTVYRGERYNRSAGSDWRFVQSYTVRRTNGAAFRTEDNLTFTKLIFPIGAGKTWDGHVSFDATQEVPVGGEILDVYNNWEYRYLNGLTDTTINDVQLSDIKTVEQADVNNLIDLRNAYERYAPGVGLVERFIDARHTQCQVCCRGDTGPCSDVPWDEKAEKGFILRQSIREIR